LPDAALVADGGRLDDFYRVGPSLAMRPARSHGIAFRGVRRAVGLAGRVLSCLPFAGDHKNATAMGKIIDAIGEAECALRLK
jgi:hypothetical protein